MSIVVERPIKKYLAWFLSLFNIALIGSVNLKPLSITHFGVSFYIFNNIYIYKLTSV